MSLLLSFERKILKNSFNKPALLRKAIFCKKNFKIWFNVVYFTSKMDAMEKNIITYQKEQDKSPSYRRIRRDSVGRFARPKHAL